MSSKDRKFSSKEYSTKNRSSENENYESNRDKTHKKSSSKSRGEKTGDKNVELEYKYKINESRDEIENEKRLKEEKRRRRVNEEVIKKENESDKKRRNHSEKVEESYEEKRHHRRTNEDENVDRRKSKVEYKTEIDRTRDNVNNEERRRHRREYEDDDGERRKKKTETKEDYEKGRQRIDRGDENNDERRRRRREYEDDDGERRKKRTETKEDHEKGKQKTEKGDDSNEMRKHRRRENDENNEKRKTKESKEESEKAKQKTDKREGQKLKESEISQDSDERRHRSKKVESLEGEEDIYRKKRSKEKEKMVFLDGVDDSVTSKMRSDGDRESEHKRRGHRESNNKEDKESYESKSNRKSNAPINVIGELNYEDDFENYDDEEFEEDLPGSTPVSNEPTATDQSSGISQLSKESGGKTSLPLAREEISKPPSTKPVKTNSSFINFRISQKKYSHDLVANRMLSRAYDLSRLIEMDKVEYDILEIAPVVEHSQYMKLFGKEGCQHEGSQTGSDNIARESQTEIIEERIVWTQCPPLDDNECFRIVSDSTESSASLARIYNNEHSLTNDKMDNSYILALMIPTLTMIENILEEETTCEIAVKVSGSHDNDNNNNNNNKQTISSGYSKYSISDGLDCLIARFAVSNSNMFVTVHQQSKSAKGKEQSKLFSPISVWKVSGNIGEPYMCLSCPGISETQSSIVCITFSPDAAASHIIGGLSCGTIALWDLKDNKSNKKCLFPAYLTSVLSEENDLYHKGPIVAMQPVNNDLSSTNSYQLISLDSWAQLVIWMVSVVNPQYNQWNLVSGSLIDLNLRPGSRYRMSKITSICLLSNSYMTSMTLDPSCNTHLFCGTNSGQIIQHTRTNQTNPDNNYNNNRSSAHRKCLGKTDQYESGAITQLDFYPFLQPYILAGYDDGLIEIFAVGKSQSLLSFHYKHQVAILQLKWSRSHPAIFFSFDVEGNLCVWNVLVDLYMPIHVQKLPGYIGFDLSSDSKWQTNRVETRMPNETRNIHNRSRLLLWALDGRVEVHELADAFSNPDLDISEKTCSLFQSLI